MNYERGIGKCNGRKCQTEYGSRLAVYQVPIAERNERKKENIK